MTNEYSVLVITNEPERVVESARLYGFPVLMCYKDQVRLKIADDNRYWSMVRAGQVCHHSKGDYVAGADYIIPKSA